MRQPPFPALIVGAGPGDPDLLTLKAARAIAQAEVILYDRLVSDGVLALASPEARMISVGKAGFGPSVPQAEIDARLVAEVQSGARVVRLKGGDPVLFGRLDEEIAALEAAGLAWEIVPGLTSASAAAAALGQSLTSRGRNSSVRLLTAHDTKGFADHDWRTLARPGEVAAIYMGKRAARYLSGRLLMHGADPATPVSVVENASRPEQRILASTLTSIGHELEAAEMDGPVLLMLGLTPRGAALSLPKLNTQEIAQ